MGWSPTHFQDLYYKPPLKGVNPFRESPQQGGNQALVAGVDGMGVSQRDSFRTQGPLTSPGPVLGHKGKVLGQAG